MIDRLGGSSPRKQDRYRKHEHVKSRDTLQLVPRNDLSQHGTLAGTLRDVA